MTIMARNSTTGTRLFGSKSLVFLRLSAMLLGYRIRLVTLRGIRLSTLISLVNLRLLIMVTLPFILLLGSGGLVVLC